MISEGYRRDLNPCSPYFKAGFASFSQVPPFFVCQYYEFFVNKEVSPEIRGKPIFHV